MNASFGIDHPLIATYDIDALRARLISIGFNMTDIGMHPWGTSTSLAMFEGCLIEIMGVADKSLLDREPAGDFRFGRHVNQYLLQREGVALTALHSTDTKSDALQAESAGFSVAGHLEFGRDVTLPDGRSDRTRTTLALMPDRQWPRLSFFLCQQHRPELIYVPQWLQHPNSVFGIAGITILADDSEQPALKKKFSGLFSNCRDIAGGFELDTANGSMRIQNQTAVEYELGALSEQIKVEQEPCIVGLDLKYDDEGRLLTCLANSACQYSKYKYGYILNDPDKWGKMKFRFVSCHASTHC